MVAAVALLLLLLEVRVHHPVVVLCPLPLQLSDTLGLAQLNERVSGFACESPELGERVAVMGIHPWQVRF
jgi:hypothetical protein